MPQFVISLSIGVRRFLSLASDPFWICCGRVPDRPATVPKERPPGHASKAGGSSCPSRFELKRTHEL